MDIEELAERLAEIIRTQDWYIASYKRKFNLLWNFPSNPPVDDNVLSWLNNRQNEYNVLIVWDGMPESKEGSINILDHLTPIDWSLAFSRHLLERYRNEPDKVVPALCIHILDLYSHYHRQAFACQMLDTIRPALPWMQVYRPFEQNDFQKLADALKGTGDIKRLNEYARFQIVESLVHAWMGHLFQSSSHHDVNNLLGPLVLSSAFNNPDLRKNLLQGRQARQALLQQAEWLGLTTPENKLKGKNAEWINVGSFHERIDGDINLVLIDDQANNGWIDIVSAAVGAERISGGSRNFVEAKDEKITKVAEGRGIAVWASTSYKCIIDKLYRRIEQLNGTDCRFELSFTENNKNEILLFDLRLVLDQNKEIDYFKDVLKLAEKFASLSDKNKWAWTGFELSTLDTLEDYLNNVEEDWRKSENYLELLTLLPRVIALMDMSLPIIIFSSSAQRRVPESVKNYRNIITTFEKPRFFGYLAENVIEQTKEKFESALKDALQLLVIRSVCIKLRNFDVPLRKDNHIQKYNYVELFIDESSPENSMYVGGCFAIFRGDDENSAQSKANHFDNDLVKGGVRYFDNFGVGPRSPVTKEKRGATASVAGELSNVIESNNTKGYIPALGVVRLRRDMPMNRGQGGILELRTADNHYRLTLKYLLEVFLYEALPAAIGEQAASQSTVSIYVATRLKFTNSLKTVREIKYKFGWRERSNDKKGHLLYSMERSSIFPFVADIISLRTLNGNRDKESIHRNIARAIGVQLVYKNNKKSTNYYLCRKCNETIEVKRSDIGNQVKNIEELIAGKLKCECNHNANFVPDYRALHYVADQILLKFPTEYNEYKEIFKFMGSFTNTIDNELETLIQAGRALDRDDRVEAIIKTALVIKNIPSDREFDVRRYILSRINRALKNLKGDEFITISKKLALMDIP